MLKDEYTPKDGERWEFNEEVATVFTDMLSRSIPAYDEMRDLMYRVARNFTKDGTNVLDIGCSTGLSSERLIADFGPRLNYVLTDVSAPMLDKCRKRYEQEILDGYVTVRHSDLRNPLPTNGCSVVLSCLTIQFTPIEYRQFIFDNIYNALADGGALILVEKVLGNSAEIDRLMVDEYYNKKRENAYSEEQIAAKRKSLEGSLVPVTSAMNEWMLRTCGFKKLDVFWRYLNFVGWIAVK